MSTIVPLPSGVTLGKSYEYGADVNTGTVETPAWTPIRQIVSLQPTWTPTQANAQTYDSLGAIDEDVTGWSWALAVGLYRWFDPTDGSFLPEVAAIESRIGDKTGTAATIQVRWYHKPKDGVANPTDAWMGTAIVAPGRGNTSPNGDPELSNYTFTGKGPATRIANPAVPDEESSSA